MRPKNCLWSLGCWLATCFALFVCVPLLHAQTARATKPIPIKVVVVAMFEIGEDTGDMPGEHQLWVEREHLDQIVSELAAFGPSRKLPQ